MAKKVIRKKKAAKAVVDPHVPDARGVKFVGGVVEMFGHSSEPKHFPNGFTWTWDRGFFQGYVNGKLVFEAPASNILCVSGPTYTRPLWPDVAAKDIQARS